MNQLVHGPIPERSEWFRATKYFVYVLLSQKDQDFYIGFTENVEERWKKHCRGEVVSTRGRRPLVLIYYEMHLNKADALRRESYFKTNKGKTTIRQILREYLKILKNA